LARLYRPHGEDNLISLYIGEAGKRERIGEKGKKKATNYLGRVRKVPPPTYSARMVVRNRK